MDIVSEHEMARIEGGILPVIIVIGAIFLVGCFLYGVGKGLTSHGCK